MEAFNRRNFLKSTTLAGTTLLTLQSIGLLNGEKREESHALQLMEAAKTGVRILGSGKHSLKVNHGMGLGCMGMSWHRTFVPDRKPMIALLQKAYIWASFL